jgi:hypothetical protein
MSSEGGKGGGGAGGDASPDRADAKTDSPGSGGTDASADRGGGGTGGTDASADGSGGSIDASQDAVAQADAPRETTVDSTVADQAAEARAPDAGPDGNDGGVTPTPDAGPDAVADVTPDRAPDVTSTPDANDAGLSGDGNDGGPVTVAASTYPWDDGTGALTPNDAGQLTWVATYPAGGGIAQLNAMVNPPVNWSAYQNLQIHVNVTGGFSSVATYHLGLQGSGDAEALNITGGDDTLQDGEQDLFLGIDDPDVARGVGNIYIVLNSNTNDAGATPPPTTIQVIDVTVLP